MSSPPATRESAHFAMTTTVGIAVILFALRQFEKQTRTNTNCSIRHEHPSYVCRIISDSYLVRLSIRQHEIGSKTARRDHARPVDDIHTHTPRRETKILPITHNKKFAIYSAQHRHQSTRNATEGGAGGQTHQPLSKRPYRKVVQAQQTPQ